MWKIVLVGKILYTRDKYRAILKKRAWKKLDAVGRFWPTGKRFSDGTVVHIVPNCGNLAINIFKFKAVVNPIRRTYSISTKSHFKMITLDFLESVITIFQKISKIKKCEIQKVFGFYGMLKDIIKCHC